MMLARCVEGDTIVITMIDRLGRSASDVLNVVEDLKARGIKLRVMQFDGMDITSSMGKMVLTCMAAMAEMERNILIERTNAGLARTKASGTKLGRPLTIEPAIMEALMDDKAQGCTLDEMSQAYGIPRNTIHRNLKEWGGKLLTYKAEWVARKTQYDSKISN
jgi:putative DNA-invertase from lambdoid prophage Rac